MDDFFSGVYMVVEENRVLESDFWFFYNVYNVYLFYYYIYS